MDKSMAYSAPGLLLALLWIMSLPIDVILDKSGLEDYAYAGLCFNLAGSGNPGIILWLSPLILGICLWVIGLYKHAWETRVQTDIENLIRSL